MSIYTCRSTTCPMAVVHLSESNAAEMGGVCPRCGGYLRPTEILASTSLPPAQDDSLKSLILERFPFPIAYGYRQIVEAPEARHAVDSAFYTYTALLRLPTLILLGQFLQGGSQNPHAAKAVQLLRTPTLESWFTALTKLAKHLFPLLPGKTVAFAPWERGGPFSPGLAAAARSFKGLKRDGHYVHERLRNLRNARAHGAIWNESDFANILPEIRALLHDALEHFSPLAELELLRKSPQGMIRLVGAQDLFEEVGIPDARLEDLFETSETALRDPDGNFLALYPLFLGEPEPFPGGYIEPLLCFDGHGQKAAVFLGTRNRVENQKVLTRYLDLLRAKDIDPRFTKEEFAPWSVAQWAREASLGTVDNLKGVKYFPDFYRERNQASKGVVIQEGADASEAAHEETCGVDDAFSRWLEMGRQAALIIASEAGAGKTSLFCRMAESLLGPSRPDGAEGDGGTECVLLVVRRHQKLTLWRHEN